MRQVAVIGVGLHPYGKWPDEEPKQLAHTAIGAALSTAGIGWKDVQTAWCGHTSLGMTAGARLFAPLGRTGLSITNVENASATGSYAFRGAYTDVATGEFDIALALGVDMLPRRDKAPSAESKPPEKTVRPPTAPMLKFAKDAREHMEKYGTTLDQLGQVSVKQHFNGARNPNAQFQKEVTLAEVHAAREVVAPLTVLHCCPFGDGAAAAVLVSEDVVRRLGIEQPVWVAASVSQSAVGSEGDLTALTATTAHEAYRRSGIGPTELGMVELHDAATIEEIQYAEALGLCAEGQGGKLVAEGATAITGRIPINSSGGLLAMGHPFGPTGLGQIAEIFWQLRGQAGARQIPARPRTGLAHMVGLGGTCVVHVLKR
ncbi:MAG TPA: thiolase family protein [Polyangiaceae bacterium]|jgi:acetyl-CoA acetyltransferase|nr:thiolase family protein [Polyangiaceae bacterium]